MRPRLWLGTILTLAVFLAATSRVRSGAPAATAKGPRLVFVLHSGVHTIFSDADPNRVSDTIQKLLIKHGVPERDIVMLDNPFPLATWKEMFPRASLTIYLESMLPGSRVSHLAYERLHKALTDRDVKPGDKLIWVGHSAGGQIGVTMAYLGRHLQHYPELARSFRSYSFDMVVTLGTPLGACPLPPDVKLRLYHSPEDKVVRFACVYGTFALSLLYAPVYLSEVPAEVSASAIARIFMGVEHPCWDEERVVSRILAELGKAYQPLWQTSRLSPALGPSLTQLLCRAMEDQLRVSLEDPLD